MSAEKSIRGTLYLDDADGNIHAEWKDVSLQEVGEIISEIRGAFSGAEGVGYSIGYFSYNTDFVEEH